MYEVKFRLTICLVESALNLIEETGPAMRCLQNGYNVLTKLI